MVQYNTSLQPRKSSLSGVRGAVYDVRFTLFGARATFAFAVPAPFGPVWPPSLPHRCAMPDIRDELQSSLGSTYTLERELGGGGMSRVFVAEETALGRKVVVKVLSPELLAGVNIDRF